jgi:CheY-like chemotaxis protein/HPt (histidine-containing phosphotransfer) domain-containing protein
MGKPLRRILLVEDEPDIQAIAKVALETLGGFAVDLASSGQQAIDRARESSPDLVLMDVMMPRMDGPTTLARLKELDGLKEVPVVFVTAKVQPPEVEHLRSIGAAAVIPKPFDPMTLAATLRSIWEGIPQGGGSRSAVLDELRRSYALLLPERMRKVEEECERFLAGPWDEGACASAHRAAHNIAGSSGTYGFHEITREARSLEALLKTSLERRLPVDSPAGAREILSRLRTLAAEARGPG